MFLYILAFLAGAVVVAAAGTFLTRSADTIADATGLGRAWVGSVLLAMATSLPELTTDIAAVRMNAPNLAAGDLFGANLANMLILALLDQMHRKGSVLRGAAIENALIACLAIITTTLGALFVLSHSAFTVWRISPESILLLLVFLGGSRAVYRNGGSREPREKPANEPVRSKKERAQLWQPLAIFGGATVAILAAAPALAWSAKHLAEMSGLGNTFVGTWLLGLTTTLPEFVTSFAAVRLGAFDLAVGNLFGSNSFNMVIFVVLDLAYPEGSIFAHLSPVNAVSGLLAVVLMSLGLASILYRAERRFIMIEPDSALMILAYLFSIFVIYTAIKM